MIRKAAAGLTLSLALCHGASALSTYCVSTSDELMAALYVTSDDVEVRIRTGTYAAPALSFSMALSSTFSKSVSGGWSGAAGQCTLQLRNPALTVLDGGGSARVLNILDTLDATSASGSLSNLTVADSQVQSAPGGCIWLRTINSMSMLIDRVAFQGCANVGGSGGAIGIHSTSSGLVKVRNSVFVGNEAGKGGAVSINTPAAHARVELVNNTIVGNVATFDGGGVFADSTSASGSTIVLLNNVVVDNTAGPDSNDVHGGSQAASIVATRNAFSVAPSGNVASTGAVIGDPGFVSAADFRPAAGSPLINAGATLSASDADSRDFAFRPRVLEGAVDIGAFESSYKVFVDGFEGGL